MPTRYNWKQGHRIHSLPLNILLILRLATSKLWWLWLLDEGKEVEVINFSRIAKAVRVRRGRGRRTQPEAKL